LEGCPSHGTMFIGLETSLSHSTLPGFILLEKGHAKTFTKKLPQHSWSDSLELGQSGMCDCIQKQTMTNVYNHCKAQQSYHVSHLYRKQT
jgi:hypothetical protein